MPQLQKLDQNGGGARRGRSRHRKPRVSSTLSEINVVPLVDVMLVLLIIFMIAAPMMQRGLDVSLPVARRADPIASQRLFVTVPLAFAQDRRVQIDDEIVSFDVLDERMRQAMLMREDKQVYLRGDGAITYQQLMEVMDKLKDGGVEQVGLVAEPPRTRR
jgi:biopolymer transport protein TolR